MTIKITEQNNQILVRRWKYSSEKKRSLPTSVYSVSKFSGVKELPRTVVDEHGVDEDEQKVFRDYMQKLDEAREGRLVKRSLENLTDNLNSAKQALTDPELKEILSLGEYERLSETINDIKKIITKNKNSLKRKAVKPTFTINIK